MHLKSLFLVATTSALHAGLVRYVLNRAFGVLDKRIHLPSPSHISFACHGRSANAASHEANSLLMQRLTGVALRLAKIVVEDLGRSLRSTRLLKGSSEDRASQIMRDAQTQLLQKAKRYSTFYPAKHVR